MNKMKKLKQETNIEALFYLFIQQRGYFDYWLDEEVFYEISETVRCSVHKVKRVFWKKLYVDKNFRVWLESFEY